MKSRNRKAVSYRLRPKIKYLFIACTTIILGLDLASAQSFTATLGSFDNATKAYALNYAPSAPSFASSPTTFVNSGLTSDVTASTAYVNYSGWDNQSNFYYYSITAASGYNLTITGINSNIRSSNTGPKTVAVETATSLGGPWTQQALSSLSGTTAADVNSPALSIALTSGQTLYIRYRNTSITSANNGTVASGGTNRLNSGSISGTYSPSCTSQTISPITSTLTKTYGDAAYSVATTASSGLTVTYSSSNTSVATVNASGTVTIVGVGTATITAAQAGNGTYCAATSVTQALTVNKKAITVAGIAANDKVFDGTIAATLSGTATLSGIVAADAGNVTLGGTGSATFADATVGSNKPVTVTGYSISGTASANYTFNQPTGLTASITAAPNSIDLSPATQPVGPYCNGSTNTISLTYTTTGTVTAPFVQLSNTSGTFVSGTTNLSSTVTGSGTFTITGTLPAGVTAGTAYRVRIVSSDATPVSSLGNGSNITIYAQPSVSANTGGATTVCEQYTTTAFTNPTGGGTWSISPGTGAATVTAGGVVTGTTAGTVSVLYTVTNGTCAVSASSPLAVNATPANPGGAVTAGANPACTSTALSFNLPSNSIYWQSVASLGTSTAQNTTTPYTVTSSGAYSVRAYNGSCWSLMSTGSGTITINAAVAITTQPTNKSVTAPTGTTFNVVANNATGYQWQVDDGSGWVNVSNGSTYNGASSATLTVSATSEAMDGNGYRVVVSGTAPCAAVTSNIVSLAVAPGPCISESFETGLPTSYGATTSYNLSSGTWTGSASQVARGTTSPTNGSYVLQLRSQPGAMVISPAISTGNANVKFYASGSTTPASVQLNYSTDGGLTWTAAPGSPFSLSTSATQYSSTISSSATSMIFQLMRTAATVYIDQFEVTCLPVTSCGTTAVTSFLPTSGPVGTRVTITGTGFTGATAVKFGGVAASSFSLVDANTITAVVPASANSGTVSVTVSGCTTQSSGSFSLISTANCGSGLSPATDLFISEVYDAVTGSLGYIEVFNGTGGTVTLTNYKIRITTGSSTINDYPMSGTLTNGSVYILRVGTSTLGTCTGFTINNDQSSASGFNGNDAISLYKSSTLIDYVPNPNATDAGGTNASAPGFSQIRHSNITSPVTTYNSSEWTVTSPESCSNLGVGPYTTGTSSVTISPQPTDYTACSVPVMFNTNYSVTPVGATSTIVWKFYNPYTDTWDNASTLPSLSQLSPGITTANTNTTSMSLSNNVAQLLNYQFYAQVSRGSCVVPTNAVRYSYNTAPHYRSNIAVGNWTTPASWQMSTDNVTWTTACSYPVAANSDDVIIRDGHTITLDQTIKLDKLTISNTGNTGQLTIPITSLLNMLNSQAGADLIVNGVLEDNGNNTNGVNLLSNSATWTLGSNATIIKTNGGSSDYRDAYETGIINIPATANWIYRRAISAPTLYVASGTSSTPMYYPNLTLENTFGGTYSSNINATPDLSTFTFIGSNNPIYIKGNFDVGGSGAYAVNFSNINSSDRVQVAGNLIIRSGNTLTNIGGTNYGNGFEVKGNITNAGTLRSNYDPSNASSGQLNLTGSTAQTVSGAGAFNLYDFTVENGAGGSVELMSDILVPNVCSLRLGVITTHASPGGLLTLGTATNAVAGNPGTTAYVNGPMAKQFAINASAEFEYPIGKSTASPVYKPNGVKPETIAGGTTTVTSEYFAGSHPLNALMGGMVLGVSSKEWWDIKKSGGNASNTARVKLYYLNPGDNNWNFYNTSGSPAYSTANVPCATCNVAVVHRDASSSTWNFTSTSGMFSSSAPIEYRSYANEGAIYSAPTSNYSPFTLAYSYNVILTLPVKLISFTGKLVVSDGKLDWKIADAKDLAYFDLESSTDGSQFSKLATVQSNGGTGYDYTDPALAPGNHYYRLLVVDKDGKKYYSQVVLLTVGTVKTYLVGVSPTVVQTQVRPVIFSAHQQKATAVITDITGRKLAEITTGLMAGTNQWSIPTTMLPRGTYQLTIFTTDGLRETRRFIKE